MRESLERADQVVDEILARVGRQLVVGLPIGLGKPVELVNELYRRALADSSIELTFLTGLSLARPRAGSPLEKRLLEPFLARVFGDCPELEYIDALRRDALPANVRVIEFYLSPGSALNWPHSQQNHLATNYTQVTRDLIDRGVNVILQRVATRVVEGQRQYSLGANPDITAELLPLLRERTASGEVAMVVGVVHPRLPFMLGDALVEAAGFDLLLDHPRFDTNLFCPPNPPLAVTDHAIGLLCSSLLKDGGTLQIGIGEMGDAICYSTLLRHQQNTAWRETRDRLSLPPSRELQQKIGGELPFARGLFACSEMFVDQLLDLYRHGVLRRRIVDCLPLERALADGSVTERFASDLLERLCEAGLPAQLDATGFEQLQRYGVFHSATRLDGGIITPEGKRLPNDLSKAAVREQLAVSGLGQRLKGGAVLQSAFLLGPQGFYAALRDLPEDERALFQMCAVGRVNSLGETDRELRRLQRRDGRFINTTMMVTLLGAAVSDGLDDGRVVSGVGGQLNFILQAMELPDARSLLCLRSTREKRGIVESNLRFAYGHATVPRHLRDVVVTEYGCADLRGRTDSEVIAALLAIADSRFQPQLLAEAKRHGKIATDYQIPAWARNNTPQRLATALAPAQRLSLFSEYPFGTDFTREEIALTRALRLLAGRTATRRGKAAVVMRALFAHRGQQYAAELARMQLEHPRTAGEHLQRRLVSWSLSQAQRLSRSHSSDEGPKA